jgi:alpha-mannosidase
MVTAVKGGEDGDDAPDLIVRAVETTGRPARAPIEIPLLGRTVTADFGPHQIRTLRVPLDGGPIREVDLIEWDLPAARPVDDEPMPAAPSGQRHAGPDHDSSDATLPSERMAPAQRRRPS